MTTATKIPPAPKWDLDCIFPGGSGSKEFADYRSKAKADLENFGPQIKSMPQKLDSSSSAAWVEIILALQALSERWEMIGSFAYCLSSQNVDDSEADRIIADYYSSASQLAKAKTELEALAAEQTDEAWAALMATAELSPPHRIVRSPSESARTTWRGYTKAAHENA